MHSSWQVPQAHQHSVIDPVYTSHDIETPTPSLPHSNMLEVGMQKFWSIYDAMTMCYQFLEQSNLIAIQAPSPYLIPFC